jgi:hypothetical protein
MRHFRNSYGDINGLNCRCDANRTSMPSIFIGMLTRRESCLATFLNILLTARSVPRINVPDRQGRGELFKAHRAIMIHITPCKPFRGFLWLSRGSEFCLVQTAIVVRVEFLKFREPRIDRRRNFHTVCSRFCFCSRHCYLPGGDERRILLGSSLRSVSRRGAADNRGE